MTPIQRPKGSQVRPHVCAREKTGEEVIATFPTPPPSPPPAFLLCRPLHSALSPHVKVRHAYAYIRRPTRRPRRPWPASIAPSIVVQTACGAPPFGRRCEHVALRLRLLDLSCYPLAARRAGLPTTTAPTTTTTTPHRNSFQRHIRRCISGLKPCQAGPKNATYLPNASCEIRTRLIALYRAAGSLVVISRRHGRVVLQARGEQMSGGHTRRPLSAPDTPLFARP